MLFRFPNLSLFANMLKLKLKTIAGTEQVRTQNLTCEKCGLKNEAEFCSKIWAIQDLNL